MRDTHARIAGVILLLFLALRSSGQQLVQENDEPAASNIWREGIGSGFNPGTWNAGASVGAGPGIHVLGCKEHHGLATAALNGAWILPEWRTGQIFAGNLELRGELFAGSQFYPNTRYITGLTAVARYDFAMGRRLVPFVDIGAGPSLTDIGPPDLGDNFEFNVQLGAGAYYFIRKNTAVSLEYRWFHVSDAGLTRSNDGVNTQMIRAGVTWFF